MNVVHLTNTINTLMKILDIISEATPPVSAPPTDPEAYLKWYFENKPKGVTVLEEPKGSWFAKQKFQYQVYEGVYRAKWGTAFKIFSTMGIVIPMLQYHASMLILNDQLKASPPQITPEEAVKARQLLAGWLVFSILVPRMLASLAGGLAGQIFGAMLGAVAETGGKAGARAKVLIALGATIISSAAAAICFSETGRQFMVENFLLRWVIYGVGGIATWAWDKLWDMLPKDLQKKLDTALGTPELQQAIDQVNAADQDLNTTGWQDRKAADRARDVEIMRRNTPSD